MVWFQCEDCGENLKKPKLSSHFRICAASKLSCIDCGVIFDQTSVQCHVQCITEAEKYGPKGQGKPLNGGATLKSVKNTKHQPDIDITVGLSQRPPWFCSLCNTSATSKQTLLGHAEGKKHRAKARAFHAANNVRAPDYSVPVSTVPAKTENDRHAQCFEDEKICVIDGVCNGNSNLDNEAKTVKTRKVETSEAHPGLKGNGLVDGENVVKKDILNGTKGIRSTEIVSVIDNTKPVESSNQKIQWRKLIKSSLRASSKKTLKMKKLGRIILNSLKDSGLADNEAELLNIIKQKVSTCSRFKVDGKYVHLIEKE